MLKIFQFWSSLEKNEEVPRKKLLSEPSKGFRNGTPCQPCAAPRKAARKLNKKPATPKREASKGEKDAKNNEKS